MTASTGALYMLASAFSFSIMSLLVKVAGQRLPSQEIVLARAIVTLFLSYGLLRRAGIPVWGKNQKMLILRGVLGFLGLACFYYSVTHLPLAEATVIQHLHPLFTAILAFLILHEKVGRMVSVSSITSLVGVVMIAQPDFLFGAAAIDLNAFDLAVAVGAAVFAAAAYVVVRHLSKTEHALVIVFYFPLVAVPASLPTVLSTAIIPQGWEWLTLLGIGIATQYGQVFLTKGLQLEPAGKAMAIAYMQILFATAWGILFFAEIPSGWTIAGGLLIIGGTLIVAWPRNEGDEKNNLSLLAESSEGRDEAALEAPSKF